jgi:hypothetical protein
VEGTTGLLIDPGEATMLIDRTLSQPDLTHRTQPGLWSELSNMVACLHDGLFSHYRPERHYMRGPGPACRAKHTRS